MTSRQAFVPLLCLVVGCVSPGGTLTKSLHHGQPHETPIHQVQALWENRVITTQDVVNQGQPLIGLAGRVYFFGEEVGQPLTGTGTLFVACHEIRPDGSTRLLEGWQIDPRTLAKLGRNDTIGWGYTVFLPWGTYRPDIARVQLQAKFVPEHGTPLFSPPSAVTLRQETAPIVSSNIIPAKSNY